MQIVLRQASGDCADGEEGFLSFCDLMGSEFVERSEP